MGVVSCGTTMLDQGVFNNIGAVTWDTTAKTAGFTAVSGNGYFVNTTSGAITVTLPSSPSAGDIVGIKDYANTADTNAITIGRNGSNIQGTAGDFVITTEGRSVLLVYVDATKGWLVTSASQASDIAPPATYITATGGTITTCGDYKIHTFTSPGTFCVTAVGNGPTNPAGGPSKVDYLVIAGGAGGGGGEGAGHGGGGAGGFRESKSGCSGCWTASPLVTPTGITITASPYPISVGGGGAGGADSPTGDYGDPGSNSIFSTITSTGGGGGAQECGGSIPITNGYGRPGGSGGGASYNGNGGSGNTPPVSPPQGQPGGNGSLTIPYLGGGGGGGAGGNGGSTSGSTAGVGGPGTTTSFNGTPTARAGGGGAGIRNAPPAPGGSGGGGDGSSPGFTATSGTTNTGSGGGGGVNTRSPRAGGSGGSGIVIIRYKYQ